ncbi:sugar porter family MFS transporter [Streptomyces sulphureus]|uniref:sugar porter family MFS transporter n=1 Tax=Streptomyces sulphureus TaxID=47758 RepID=UPI0004758F4D|nr:sugar porter family MFS transporter [Streptomyces sulphureus]
MSTSTTASSKAPLHVRGVPSWFIYVFGALGAVLWGYDTGVISGALLYIKRDFAISSAGQGLVTSSFTIGAAAGALITALLVDRLGRKKLLLIAAGIFVVGTLMSGLAGDEVVLIIGRAVLGIGIGFVSVNIPIYLSEISPARIRGRIVSLTQFMNATGILLAYLSNLAFSPAGAWRWMIGIAVVPAVLLFFGVLFLPESPRWLVGKGRIADARATLAARDDGADPGVTIREIEEGLAAGRGAWRSLLRPWARKPAAIAVLMTVLAQFLGINAITYYAPTVLTSVGFSDSASLITTVGFGAISVVATVFAVRYGDSVGRRPLLIVGAAITGTTMLLTAIFSWSFGITAGITGVVAIICFCLFKGAFSSTWGPISRVVETEILPISIRGTAMSVAEVANFMAIFVVTLFFPILLQAGSGFAFFTFALMGAVAVAVIVFFVPETRGRTLEEIEAEMREGPAARAAQRNGTPAPADDAASAARVD